MSCSGAWAGQNPAPWTRHSHCLVTRESHTPPEHARARSLRAHTGSRTQDDSFGAGKGDKSTGRYSAELRFSGSSKYQCCLLSHAHGPQASPPHQQRRGQLTGTASPAGIPSCQRAHFPRAALGCRPRHICLCLRASPCPTRSVHHSFLCLGHSYATCKIKCQPLSLKAFPKSVIHPCVRPPCWNTPRLENYLSAYLPSLASGPNDFTENRPGDTRGSAQTVWLVSTGHPQSQALEAVVGSGTGQS